MSGHDQSSADAPPLTSGIRDKVIGRACKHFKRGQIETFYEKLAIASFRQSAVSVALAKPDLPDCPLIGVSVGFEVLTGYSQPEVLGKNCRFLNRGCPMRADVRQELRIGVRTHQPVACVVTNRRRNGDKFRNLLHMSSLRIGRSRYILGIQAEVHSQEEEQSSHGHTEELQRIADRILATIKEAWAELEPSFGQGTQLSKLAMPSEVSLESGGSGEDALQHGAKSSFVSLAPFDPLTLSTANTFVEVRNDSCRPGELLSRLRRASSEPALGSRGIEAFGEPIVPLAALRDTLQHISKSAVQPFSDRPGAPLPSIGGDDEEVEEPRSIGSVLHPNGCKPCSFYCYSLMGCIKGMACPYCHMEHPRCNRRRKKKPAPGEGQGSSASSSGVIQEGRGEPDLKQTRVPSGGSD